MTEEELLIPGGIVSPEITSRSDFGMLCNARGLTVAVEIGVDRGHNAANFLKEWDGYAFWAVDPYEPYYEMGWDRSSDMAMAINVLSKWNDRARLVRLTSEEACKAIPGDVGFVYIDANHTYESISRDIELWWPRLSPNGILAGHDYYEEHLGVVKAVNEFSIKNRALIYTTREVGVAPSWYAYKDQGTAPILCARRD